MLVGAIFLTANGAGLPGRGFTIMYIVSQVWPPCLNSASSIASCKQTAPAHIKPLRIFDQHVTAPSLLCSLASGGVCILCDLPQAHPDRALPVCAQFLFGYGVGGEYPMAAGSAAERAEAGGKRKAAKRGQEVVLTFSMQGVPHHSITTSLLLALGWPASDSRPLAQLPS